MHENTITIKKVLVDEGASEHAFTGSILSRLPDVPVLPAIKINADKHTEKSSMEKDVLHLLSNKGDFLKPCPGAKGYICCGYQILSLATNCPIDCSYCILQSYFNQPYLRVFVNFQEKLSEILRIIDSKSEKIFRIGTGEFTDSLALDHLTGFSDFLLPVFSRKKNAVLELKTKTDRIERILKSKHRDRIIVSWSLNSPYIVAREERKAASLRKRLEAARLCQSEGFALGFHFDPLIYHEHWQEEYLKTVEMIHKYIKPERIIWISLGSFRFMPELKIIIRKHHRESCVLNGEFIIGLDGKMRYFKPIRVDLYSYIKETLEKWHPNPGIYLCMESDDVWKRTFGWSPENSERLSNFLDRRVEKIFR